MHRALQATCLVGSAVLSDVEVADSLLHRRECHACSMLGRAAGEPLIPFNRPAQVGRELECIAEAISSDHASSGGIFSSRVAELLTSDLGAADVLLTTS